MSCHAMHPIQDLFLESFSYELQFDMHFLCTPSCANLSILVKVGVTPGRAIRGRWSIQKGSTMREPWLF
jgi:hypothetical protein